MPIHDMAWWPPFLDNVILFLEDPCKKQVVGLVCTIKKLDDTLASTNIEKGVGVKKIKDIDTKVVLEKWIEFKELIELEGEDTTRDSQGVFQHTIAMVENSIIKQPRKEETKAERKENILGKEAKGFDHIECLIKDVRIGEEYEKIIPHGFTPVEGVNIHVNHFKRLPLEIVYCPLSKKHVSEIKM
jgi:hypothetical protein